MVVAVFPGFQLPLYQRYVFLGTQFCYHGHWPRQEPIFLKTESLKFPKLVQEWNALLSKLTEPLIRPPIPLKMLKLPWIYRS